MSVNEVWSDLTALAEEGRLGRKCVRRLQKALAYLEKHPEAHRDGYLRASLRAFNLRAPRPGEIRRAAYLLGWTTEADLRSHSRILMLGGAVEWIAMMCCGFAGMGVWDEGLRFFGELRRLGELALYCASGGIPLFTLVYLFGERPENARILRLRALLEERRKEGATPAAYGRP